LAGSQNHVALDDGSNAERFCYASRDEQAITTRKANMNLPSIDVSSARLPAAYEQAKTALATCSSIDECETWKDKAIAMASYARQAQDESLFQYATRIKARAVRRCGALLQATPKSKGGDPSLFNAQGGDPPSVTRTQAAKDAGLSNDERRTALRVAAVPAAQFEEQVESNNPPSITALAEQGKKAVDLGNIAPSDYKTATRVMGALREFAKFCEETNPGTAVRGFKPHELDSLRRCIAVADAWLDTFSVNL
jgi:hypothetical protein